MNKIQLILRTRSIYNKSFIIKRFKNKSSSSSSSTSSDEENKTKPQENKDKAQEALKKLNTLLNNIVQENTIASATKKLDLAKPSNKRKPKESEKPTEESLNTDTNDNKLAEAVKNVAKCIGGDVKQTESELLQKLLSPVEPKDGKIKNLTDIVKGMKIDRETKPVEETRSDQVRKILQRVSQVRKPQKQEYFSAKKQRRPSPADEATYESINLFGDETLGIFDVKDQAESSEGPQIKTFEKLKQKEMKLAVTHPPANYFQEMILWTEQGKIWKFPIDNEQGMEEEQNVDFTEHIFLEKYLEPWCPPKGPIRHFMELVCVGLSKNPYITVEHKKEHIQWYRKYFEDKKKLLQEVGALQGHDLSGNKALEEK